MFTNDTLFFCAGLRRVTTWVRDGFPLMHDNTLHGKHHGLNYKSALSFRAQTHKSLIKRLNTHKTAGPYQWSGDINDLPFDDCAINSLGAVPYKLEPDRARACDDSAINVAITPPHFKQPALQQLREAAYPGCSWSKSDIAAAFPTMNVRQQDLVWLMFAWCAPEDTEFKGTDQDCLPVCAYARQFWPTPMAIRVHHAHGLCQHSSTRSRHRFSA